MSDRPAWFEEAEEEVPRRRRLVPVLAAVAVLWLGVSLVLARGGPGATSTEPLTQQLHADGHAADSSTDAAAGDTAADPSLQPSPAHAGSGPGRQDAPAATAVPDVDIGHDEAAAIVTAVVRGWLSDAGPDLAIPGLEVDRGAYLEHLSVERFDLPGPDVAVARTLLVLLVRDQDHYTEVLLRRAAVPLVLTAEGALPAGQPWWLPEEPDLAVAAPATEPVDDPQLALEVLEALETAGYGEVAVTDLARAGSGALVAEIEAVTPSGDVVAAPVWLLVSADGSPQLAGAAPPPPTHAGPPSTDTPDRPTD